MRDDKIIIKVDGVEFESTLPDAIDTLFQLLRLRDVKAAHPLTPGPPNAEPTPTVPPVFVPPPVYVPVPFYVQPYPPAWLWPPYTISCTTTGEIKATP